MIYLDSRVGSKELLRLFPRGMAELTHLEYADAMITGHDEDGDILIGIERKQIGDFVNSMCSGRLSGHQLIGMLNSYHHIYLVIEGMFRANPDTGLLEVWRRGGFQPFTAGRRMFMARDIWVFMNTLEIVCGIHCYHCSRDTDTVHYMMALHHWWGKEYADHRGHLQPHNHRVVELSKQSLTRRWAACLDGIGWEKSKALDTAFRTPLDLAMASEEELKEVEGIGGGLSKSIIKQIRG